jgi:hypothetical protein
MPAVIWAEHSIALSFLLVPGGFGLDNLAAPAQNPLVLSQLGNSRIPRASW